MLFIAGAGRSGSTIVESLIGQDPAFTAVGELRHVWGRGLLADERCGCGRPFHQCPFWRDAVSSAFGSFDQGRSRAPELRRLQQRIDRMWRIPQLRLGGRGPGMRAALREYGQALRSLYLGVLDRSGGSVVVDASKSSSHAFILWAGDVADVRVLHLVRDARAVAHSWRRLVGRPEVVEGEAAMPTYGPVRSSTDWAVMNMGAAATRRLGVPYVRVRYEDLMADPGPGVVAAVRRLGLPSPAIPMVDGATAHLEPSHTVSGNPVRFRTGRVSLRPDVEWIRSMSRTDRAVVTALTWPLLVRYGYGLRGSTAPGMERPRNEGLR